MSLEPPFLHPTKEILSPGLVSVDRSYMDQMHIYWMVTGMNVTTAPQRMSPALAAKALGEDKEPDYAKSLLRFRALLRLRTHTRVPPTL